MDEKNFFVAYRNSLYEGFLSGENSPLANMERLKELKTLLDGFEPKYLNKQLTIDDLVTGVRELLIKPLDGMSPMWNPKRDLCIIGCMALGAAILAAWVASGGTLIVGTLVAGFSVTSPIIAALIGGATAGTIACMAGSCGNC